jgi:uncharacterized RDD family membrane protein YckC
MRCPKCHYISFDTGDRCRNCGYEFALAVDARDADLPIQTGDEAIGPLSDFTLSDSRRPSTVKLVDQTPSAPADSAAIPQPRPITSSFDLPLFRDRSVGEAPLVAPPANPRPPLSVRRSNVAAGRPVARVHLDEPELDLGDPTPDLDTPKAVAAAPVSAKPVVTRAHPDVRAAAEESDAIAAPSGSRLFAGILDALIVGTISAVVLYLTLKVCGLGTAQIALIPLVPFGSFLLLLAGAYFTLFVAANGQTIGKMATGLKVVPADADGHRVSLGTALVRAAAYIVSALPAGVGFVLALFASDGRALHDRLAATRVVKA